MTTRPKPHRFKLRSGVAAYSDWSERNLSTSVSAACDAFLMSRGTWTPENGTESWVMRVERERAKQAKYSVPIERQ